MKLVNAALDDARRKEQPHRPELKRSRYAWLTNPVNASAGQRTTLARLSTLNLQTATAYQMRLNVPAVWECSTAAAAERSLRRWCTWVTRVAKPPKDPAQVWVLEARHRTAQTLREHAVGILNYFRQQLTSGVIESVNGLVQAARSRARGYRNVETFKTIIDLLAGRLHYRLPALALLCHVTHAAAGGRMRDSGDIGGG